jgi:hypothetical protein
MFKVSPASLQTFIDTPNCVLEERVQYSMIHVPNVLCDGHLQIINFVGIARIHCSTDNTTSFLPHYLAQSDCLAANRQGKVDTNSICCP